MKRILVVDDEQSMREVLGIMLRKEGYEVFLADSRSQAARVLETGRVEMVITDVKLPDGDGIEILRHVKAASPETAVVVMTAFGSTQTAVAALKLGAQDYLVKPFEIDELKIVVRNAFEKEELKSENRLLKAQFGARHGLDRIIGSSPAMAAVFNTVRSIAPTGSTVLVLGESGTGKELVAKAIHALSPRRDFPFVSINCGALPETLLESELFGHVKGAFTDAQQNKKGLFEAAHRGTLFLDEVGETPAAMQVKLLRSLQERVVRRVGGTEEIEIDVRVIAAANRPLEALVAERRFREDLFYRLNVIPIHLPPLRERKEDIPLLVEAFVKRFSRELGKNISGVTESAVTLLEGYSWPGNVRELENVIERAIALESSGVLDVERFRSALGNHLRRPDAPTLGTGFNLDEHILTVEETLVRRALETARGERRDAARLLGITPRSLRYLIRKHQLHRWSEDGLERGPGPSEPSKS